MRTLDQPTENMLPRILLARLYDTVAMKHTVKNRVSESYELSLYLEGSGTVNIQGTEYPVVPGAIRFTTPGTILSSTPDYRCITVFFDFGEKNTLLRNPILDGIPTFWNAGFAHREEFENLLRAHCSTFPTALMRQNSILLSLLATLYERVHTERKRSNAVSTCIGYMKENFKENITLEDLGALTGYSNLHLLRLFKQDLGQSPHQYLTVLRLEQAKRMLSETDMNLEQIAAACGFRSVSHFKTLFKQQTYYTPGSYRKNTRIL